MTFFLVGTNPFARVFWLEGVAFLLLCIQSVATQYWYANENLGLHMQTLYYNHFNTSKTFCGEVPVDQLTLLMKLGEDRKNSSSEKTILAILSYILIGKKDMEW